MVGMRKTGKPERHRSVPTHLRARSDRRCRPVFSRRPPRRLRRGRCVGLRQLALPQDQRHAARLFRSRRGRGTGRADQSIRRGHTIRRPRCSVARRVDRTKPSSPRSSRRAGRRRTLRLLFRAHSACTCPSACRALRMGLASGNGAPAHGQTLSSGERDFPGLRCDRGSEPARYCRTGRTRCQTCERHPHRRAGSDCPTPGVSGYRIGDQA